MKPPAIETIPEEKIWNPPQEFDFSFDKNIYAKLQKKLRLTLQGLS